MKAYQASIEDLEGVSNLFNSYRMFYEQPSDLEGAAKYIKERMEKEESVILVVKNDQKYMGFAQLYPVFSSISMKKSWILNDMFVDLEARKLGIGQPLLNQAKDFAVKTGAKSIVLETAPDNYAAQKLYEKNGYERDTQLFHYELSLM